MQLHIYGLLLTAFALVFWVWFGTWLIRARRWPYTGVRHISQSMLPALSGIVYYGLGLTLTRFVINWSIPEWQLYLFVFISIIASHVVFYFAEITATTGYSSKRDHSAEAVIYYGLLCVLGLLVCVGLIYPIRTENAVGWRALQMTSTLSVFIFPLVFFWISRSMWRCLGYKPSKLDYPGLDYELRQVSKARPLCGPVVWTNHNPTTREKRLLPLIFQIGGRIGIQITHDLLQKVRTEAITAAYAVRLVGVEDGYKRWSRVGPLKRSKQQFSDALVEFDSYYNDLPEETVRSIHRRFPRLNGLD